MSDTSLLGSGSSHQGMRCPNCHADLVMSERQGIEIDYCPKCRGVWLDRGELDKIIERSSEQNQPGPAHAAPTLQQPPPPSYQDRGYEDRGRRDDRYDHGGKRRKSWLSEIFD